MMTDEQPIVASDQEVEGNAVGRLISESLSPPQIEHLKTVLTTDPMMGEVLDAILTRAIEFSGEGSVEGPGDGTSDDIPARLSDGEFVFTAKAVEMIGEDVLQQMMEEAEAMAEQQENAPQEVITPAQPSLLSRTA